MDENRVRVTCETLLIPPFESLYSPQLKVNDICPPVYLYIT
jgi:hypothetical protein